MSEPTSEAGSGSVVVATSQSEPVFDADQLVSYEHPDPVTGEVLEGIGIVLEVLLEDGTVRSGGAVRVAPLADTWLNLEVAPENVTGSKSRGKRVSYRHPDPITGTPLTGDAVVIGARRDAVTLSPVLADRFLEVAPENLSTVAVPSE